MFCEKCGTKNEDNSKFCEECGAVLANEEGENDFSDFSSKGTFVAPNLNAGTTGALAVEKKPMSLKNKILLILSGVIILLCGGLYSFGKMATDPKKIVERYFENISAQKYEEAYEYMDIADNEFTTKEMFVTVMENRNGDDKTNILNYTVKEEPQQNPLMKEYAVTYTQKGTGSSSVAYITLMKQNSKKWLLFDDYKIAESDLTAKDYSVTIPQGTEVYIDGIKVSENYAEKQEETSYYGGIKEKFYTIPSIFVGTHKIKVSSPFSKDKEFDKYIEDAGYIDINSVELTDNAKAEVSKIAEEFLNTFVTSAINKKSLDEMSDYFASTADMESIEEVYDDLTDWAIDDEGVGVKSITFYEFDSTPEKEYQSDYQYGVSSTFQYNYTLLEEDWFDEIIEEYTPDNPKTGRANVYFVYQDGKWLISDLWMNIYFY